MSTESHLYPPPAALTKSANVAGPAAYQRLVDEAERDYEGYWSRLAREFVTWKKPFTKGLDASNAPFFKWFEDGTLNVSYNCLDRNVERGLGDEDGDHLRGRRRCRHARQLRASCWPRCASSPTR